MSIHLVLPVDQYRVSAACTTVKKTHRTHWLKAKVYRRTQVMCRETTCMPTYIRIEATKHTIASGHHWHTHTQTNGAGKEMKRGREVTGQPQLRGRGGELQANRRERITQETESPHTVVSENGTDNGMRVYIPKLRETGIGGNKKRTHSVGGGGGGALNFCSPTHPSSRLSLRENARESACRAYWSMEQHTYPSSAVLFPPRLSVFAGLLPHRGYEHKQLQKNGVTDMVTFRPKERLWA